MAKLQTHVSEAYWEAHFQPILAAVRAHLGPQTDWTEAEIHRRAAFDLRLVPAADLAVKLWKCCILDTVQSITCAIERVDFDEGPYVRLEVDYPGKFPEPPLLVEPFGRRVRARWRGGHV